SSSGLVRSPVSFILRPRPAIPPRPMIRRKPASLGHPAKVHGPAALVLPSLRTWVRSKIRAEGPKDGERERGRKGENAKEGRDRPGGWFPFPFPFAFSPFRFLSRSQSFRWVARIMDRTRGSGAAVFRQSHYREGVFPLQRA